MRSARSVFLLLPLAAAAQTVPAPTALAPVTVASSRVANQAPAGTFAMPVTALRFEPQVDVQGRNLAEGQADVTLRGGIFENTGFQIGGVTVTDPQTGHYFAELPIAPAMLTTPTVVTGADLALGAANANVGAVTYGWRPIATTGAATAGMGEFALRRADFYQGYATGPVAGARFGADVSWAHSKSDGSVPYGEHDFNRVAARVQRVGAMAQSDVFAGYQSKRFGWPNLYTPFNSKETENLETTLFAGNHRVALGGGDFAEVGVYHRRNKDDYAFNRFAPLGPVHPFQHTTWESGAAATLRRDLGPVVLGLRGEVLADDLKSTSLTFGRYHSRTITKFAAVPEKSWTAADGGRTTLKAGAAFEDSNRDSGAFSPVVALERTFASGALRRVFLDYRAASQLPTYTALNSSATSGLFRGNATLGRERSRNVELGAAGAFAGWAVEGAVFWRRDDRLVDWTFRRGVVARTANAVDVDTTGAELIARRSWAWVDVVLGYTVLTKDADYRGASVDASFYALNYARHRLTAAVTARLGHGFEVRVDNVARIQADNPLRAVGGDEALVSAVAVAYRPQDWHGVEISVQADNVWNSNFQDIPAVPAARRQVSAGVSYVW